MRKKLRQNKFRITTPIRGEQYRDLGVQSPYMTTGGAPCTTCIKVVDGQDVPNSEFPAENDGNCSPCASGNGTEMAANIFKKRTSGFAGDYFNRY